MPKTPKCTGCGGEGHYKINCRVTPRTPIQPKSEKTKRKPAVKKITRKKAKENAWSAFSIYIRTRDCIKTSGSVLVGDCITCSIRGDRNPRIPFNKAQAGHAIGGRSNAILFHEEIVHLQCGYCNQIPPYGLGGDYGNYAIALIEMYGMERYKELQKLKGTEKQFKLHDFLEIEALYKQKTKELLEKVLQ